MCPQSSPQRGAPLALQLPPEFAQTIAVALADELERRGALAPQVDAPWLDVASAAEYICAGSKQRVYDLVHAGELVPARDGRRLLFRRDALDAYLGGEKA